MDSAGMHMSTAVNRMVVIVFTNIICKLFTRNQFSF